ncbi:putative B3 domain-containing protein At3g49610 [Magnolia sinica]|uniref:putative B3 domain-containing protein At3g49610 n=1 Tax=Magnolia sinica TaxID=86752 RepID=UPI00265A16FF|nr:putative B3 domain-containing protein At3g49610 [Magnolia sinica]
MEADWSNLLMLAEVAASASPLLPTFTIIPSNNRKKRKLNDHRNKKQTPRNTSYQNLCIAKPSPPDWIETQFQLKATSLIWVCDKLLKPSDTRPRQNRLLLPTSLISHTLLPALTPHQTSKLITDGGIDGVTLDHKGRHWITRFNYWRSSGCYTLNGSWTELVDANELRANFHTVRVWVFYYGPQNQELGFIVHNKED